MNNSILINYILMLVLNNIYKLISKVLAPERSVSKRHYFLEKYRKTNFKQITKYISISQTNKKRKWLEKVMGEGVVFVITL